MASQHKQARKNAINELKAEAREYMQSLHPWQQELKNILDQAIDPSCIYWVVDTSGNTGKTTFMKMYRRLNAENTIILSGTVNNMRTQAAKMPMRRTVFLDLPRYMCKTNENGQIDHYVSYKSLRDIKTGNFENDMNFSDRDCHLVIFANFVPKPNLIEWDRWRICFIDCCTNSWVIKKFECDQDTTAPEPDWIENLVPEYL